MPESPAYRDDYAGTKWGNNGNTAKLLAVKWCSDNGFYNTKDIWDKGGWKFSANCDGNVPSDWSKRYSNESAREINSNWNRNDAARKNCQDRGYLGIDENQWKSGTYWDFSLKCVNPGWLGDWKNNGCQSDGKTRYARQVDAKGMDWDQAADWLITNDTKQHNFTTITKEKNNGMWVIGYRDENNCFIYNEQLNTNQCISVGKRNVSKKCNNWPDKWTASQDVINACKKNAPDGSTVINPAGTQWVGAEWIQDDTSCNPGWLGNWKDDGCKTDGKRRYARQVDAKGTDWDKAADWLVNNNEVKQQNFTTITKENKGVGGMWIVGYRNDVNCNPTWSDTNQKCDSQGSQMTWQHCTNWANNDAKSCLEAPNKPSNIIGWIPCAIGSDPTSIACSAFSNDFNCKLGQECYGVTQYAKFPNNGSCDTTSFGDSKKICDSKAGSITYKKCSNWFNNDEKSCLNTLKPK